MRTRALLPYPRRSFLGYRLLQEYFSFPEKFFFIDLEGLAPRLDDRASTDRPRLSFSSDPTSRAAQADARARHHGENIQARLHADRESVRTDVPSRFCSIRRSSSTRSFPMCGARTRPRSSRWTRLSASIRTLDEGDDALRAFLLLSPRDDAARSKQTFWIGKPPAVAPAQRRRHGDVAHARGPVEPARSCPMRTR